jgi:peroxiredoxin Q/BCP
MTQADPDAIPADPPVESAQADPEPQVRLAPGDLAPDFTLSDDTGAQVSLSGLRGQRVVLYAYPKAMTPGCTTQACDFRDSLDALAAAGIVVLGISPDSPAALARFRARDQLTFPLLSDPDRSVLRSYGAWGTKMMYGKATTGVIRSTWVIDEQGRIEVAMYNVRAKGHVAKLRGELGV